MNYNHKVMRFLFGSALLLLIFIGLPLMAISQKEEPFTLSSPAFADKSALPLQYTGEGSDISPPLSWTLAPKGTVSFALICDDPDASGGPWVHWILYNIPSTLSHITEGSVNLPSSAIVGANSWEKMKYQGPNPPPGKLHHYRFKLYALDKMLTLPKAATVEAVQEAMWTHILGTTSLVGLFERK